MTKQSGKSQSTHVSPSVPIGGVQKVSLVDYPGHVAAALFTIGCNMRCGYCHNPELVLPDRYIDSIPEQDVLLFLESRIGKLDGVVISGGEPTIHEGLPSLAARIKEMGYLVKLDSNGTHPDMIRQMLDEKTLDFMAMDIKGPLEKYQEIAAYPVDTVAVQRTIELLRHAGIGYEFRTTIVKSQLSPKDFESIGELIKGAPRFALQRFRPGTTLHPAFRYETTYSDEEFEELKKIMERYVDECVIH
ncbi:MAG TPA: anaerobic ribonucleoside-triphosphate reductase activating protein [Candidatus Saccharibacteria bacterium]|mgnify:CR=1 FL=1|nr:anaerobic ribonucleoside-triphosphate reductase activating protein [Candidatus Saccharibacteria bacterium]